MKMQTLLASAMLAILAVGNASANGFSQVTEESRFVSLVSGKQLTRFGIKLGVTPDGQIKGKAFGKTVSGAWRWNSGLFCRDLYFGDRDLGPNCQVVKIDGSTIRFISDKGAGDHADFGLK